MIRPDEADALLNEEFDLVDPAKKTSAKPRAQSVKKAAALTPLFDPAESGVVELSVAESLRSISPRQDRLELDAYLASALTGLTPEQYSHIALLSDSISGVCAAQGIDLYEPRKATDPVHHADVSASDVFNIDRSRVVNSDLLIVLSHHPSFGAGQELDFAHNAMVPIIVIVPAGRKLSRMVKGIPGMVLEIEYEEPEGLREELKKVLEIVRPLLVQRKLQFAKHDVNVVGDRIRRAREAAGLTRSALAAAAHNELPISESMLAHWEESSDRQSNLSLIQLREIAVLLNLSVAELVEPNIDALYLSFVNSLLDSADEQVAARWGQYSTADRKRIVLRLLERFGIELGVDKDR